MQTPNPTRTTSQALAGALVISLALQSQGFAADGDAAVLDLGLEQLMKLVVTSVSKKAQSLADTAAAAFVITADDIRRSGATSIPEALRMAPGVQVSAIGNNKWAVSIRGSADRFSNKLLVLVDGRSVYTPLFSGVLWESLDVPLQNVERIEVIRGPGAVTWGANAVNGVINIITRSAFDTQGGLVSAAVGTELRGAGFARYGWSPDSDTAVRLHVRAEDFGPSYSAHGGPEEDSWQTLGAGFRWDRRLADGSLLLEGGVSSSRAGDQLTLFSAPPAVHQVSATQKTEDLHLLGRWERTLSATANESWQAFLERSHYDHVILTEHRTTLDLEYQRRLRVGESHDVIWGLGYRYSADSIEDSSLILVMEEERSTSLYSAYLQDEITLVPERWRLTLGARLEHNDYTGFEFQPNVRLLWTPDERNSAWASLARAVRSPSRIERGGAAYVQADPIGIPPWLPPSVVQLVSRQLGEERLDALDVGWRHQLSPTASLDLAGFYYRYDQLRGAAAAPPIFVFPPGYLLIQTRDNNDNAATAWGLEAALDWRPLPEWRLQAAYSWLHFDVDTASTPGQIESDYGGTSPAHMVSLRSSVDLSPTLHWDTWLRYTSNIERYDIPAYTTLDLRLAWQPSKALEVAVVGQNLLDSAHPEFASNFILSAPMEVQRGVYLRADWKF